VSGDRSDRVGQPVAPRVAPLCPGCGKGMWPAQAWAHVKCASPGSAVEVPHVTETVTETPKRKVGRPRKAGALSNAERQRAFRKRKTDAGN
jgi:hypothetical protein